MTSSEPQKVNWQDYLDIIVRRRWWFAVPCLTIVIGTMLVTMFLTPIYRAVSYVIIENPQIMNPLMRDMAIATDVQQTIRVVREELLGYTSVSRLIDKLDLAEDIKTQRERDELIEELQKNIVVSITKRGQLIEIHYSSPNPALAQDIVNTVTEVYIERNVEAQTREAEQAIKFIESEMAVYKGKLEEAERAVREFRELYGMEAPVAIALNDRIVGREISLAQMLVHNTEVHPAVIQTQREIADLKARRNAELRKLVARAMAKGRNPEIYEDLHAQLNAAAEGRAGLDSADPTVREAHEAYETWVERMDHVVVAAAGQGAEPGPAAQEGASPAGGALQTAAVPGGSGAAGGPTSIILLPRQQQELARLMRDYEIHKETYHRMQQRLETAKITQRFGQSDEGVKFRVIEPAQLPSKPVFPNVMLFFAGSLVIGVTFGSLLVFTVEWLDESFQSAEEVQSVLELPVLGAISRIVTEADVAERKKRRQQWFSFRGPANWLRALRLNPVAAQVDRFLLRLGL